MADSEMARTGVEVITRTAPIAFLMLLFKTNISIDGNTHVVKWGSSFYELEPGRHMIEIGYRYFFRRNIGRNHVEVDVTSGHSVRVNYHAPNHLTAPGPIIID